MLKIYKAGSYQKRGLSIEQVIVHEPPRYYVPGSRVDTVELAARGLIVNVGVPDSTLPSPQTPAVVAAPDQMPVVVHDPVQSPVPAGQIAPASVAGVPANTVMQDGLALPGPSAAQVASATPVKGSAEDEVARLKQELAEALAKNSVQAPVGESAVVGPDPWQTPTGIAYAG